MKPYPIEGVWQNRFIGIQFYLSFLMPLLVREVGAMDADYNLHLFLA